MKKYRFAAGACVLAFSLLCSTQGYASGVPTVDPATIAAIAKWGEQAEQMKTQINNQKEQIINSIGPGPVLNFLKALKFADSYILSPDKYANMHEAMLGGKTIPGVSPAAVKNLKSSGQEKFCNSLKSPKFRRICIQKSVIREEFAADLEKSQRIAQDRASNFKKIKGVIEKITTPKNAYALQSYLATLQADMEQERQRMENMQKLYDEKMKLIEVQTQNNAKSFLYGN